MITKLSPLQAKTFKRTQGVQHSGSLSPCPVWYQARWPCLYCDLLLDACLFIYQTSEHVHVNPTQNKKWFQVSPPPHFPLVFPFQSPTKEPSRNRWLPHRTDIALGIDEAGSGTHLATVDENLGTSNMSVPIHPSIHPKKELTDESFHHSPPPSPWWYQYSQFSRSPSVEPCAEPPRHGQGQSGPGPS